MFSFRDRYTREGTRRTGFIANVRLVRLKCDREFSHRRIRREIGVTEFPGLAGGERREEGDGARRAASLLAENPIAALVAFPSSARPS